MTARTINTIVALAFAVLGGCGDTTGPATELMVENRTGSTLEVLSGECGLEVELFAVLDDGGSHTEQVAPGCWRVEGGGGYGVVHVTEGTLKRVVFHANGAIRGR